MPAVALHYHFLIDTFILRLECTTYTVRAYTIVLSSRRMTFPVATDVVVKGIKAGEAKVWSGKQPEGDEHKSNKQWSVLTVWKKLDQDRLVR